MSENRATIVVELVVESDDGPAAFEYFEASVDEVLDAGTFQDAVCEHLSDNHPVNTEIVSATCRRKLLPEPPTSELSGQLVAALDSFTFGLERAIPDGDEREQALASIREMRIVLSRIGEPLDVPTEVASARNLLHAVSTEADEDLDERVTEAMNVLTGLLERSVSTRVDTPLEVLRDLFAAVTDPDAFPIAEDETPFGTEPRLVENPRITDALKRAKVLLLAGGMMPAKET